MARYPIGKSSYGELKGVMQYVTDEYVAAQFNTLAMEWDAEQTNGDRLTPNEGIRSRARQALLWNRWDTFCKYGTPIANLAAYPFTSIHDEELHGLAIDIGITDKNGNNRAPTPAEFARIYELGARRGIVHTGGSFTPPESWHMQGGFAVSVPPLASPRIAGSPITIITTPVGDSVSSSIIKVTAKTKGKPANVFLVNPDTMQCLHLASPTQVKYWVARGITFKSDVQSYTVLNGFTRVKGAGAL